ncbi:ABC transporter ATP-binding protein [Waltera acetigignens]|jgi:ABC-2 type transport system ATP-binding protein
MIEVTNLTKKYGDHIAVDHLSFRVEKGQIYGFLGPNGAGKSTTMNIITGYLAATEGTVTIDGKDIQKDPEEAKRSIGYLPELPPLYVDMTVREYLEFVAELKKVPKKERKQQIDEVMEMTQITDMQQRLIKNLSKGYRQRVGLAQAILGYPEVIILDEPTVGLDPKQIIEIRDLIRKLGENHTVILSSHILSEVSAVCDHIMIIAHGKLVASDSPENLQKLMSGSMELNLEVKGSAAAVKSALQEISQIDRIEENTEASKNVAKLKVISKENADIREQVFYALADAKLPILEMTHAEKSLEDIFLELTEDVAPSQPEKKKLFTRHKKVAAVGENADNNAEASDEGSINTNSSDSVSATTGVNVSESSESKADTAATKEAE